MIKTGDKMGAPVPPQHQRSSIEVNGPDLQLVDIDIASLESMELCHFTQERDLATVV